MSIRRLPGSPAPGDQFYSRYDERDRPWTVALVKDGRVTLVRGTEVRAPLRATFENLYVQVGSRVDQKMGP